jgi:hypothetical protein
MMPFSRREALRTIGGGFGMFGLASMMGASAPTTQAGLLSPRTPHFPPKVKRVVFLFLNGGLSHVDSFDPKPALAKYNGQPSPIGNPKTERKTGNLMASPFPFKNRGKSGIPVSSLFPKFGEQFIDDVCVIRSMTTDIPNHPPSILMLNCGRNVPGTPSLGAWITYGLGTENQNLPGYVVLCPGRPSPAGAQLWGSAFLPAAYQGTRIMNKQGVTDPEKLIQFMRNSQVSNEQQTRQLSLLRMLNQEHMERKEGAPELEASIQSMEVAYRMQSEAMDAFDVRKESTETQARYGATEFGRGCLLARRLLERGVRVVQVYYGDQESWDHHSDIMIHEQLAYDTDQALTAFFQDLKSTGMFEDTLVLIGSEFGRTPTSEVSVRQFMQNGRDHNPYGYTVLLAGGGVKRGFIHGATDEFGWFAIEGKAHVHDLHATMLHLLGFDHTKLTYQFSGRPFRLTDVEGELIRNILA